jgi:hypothetical protein
MTEMDDENFYAPPESWELHQEQMKMDPNAAWRDGELLMARQGAVLPDRCLKCNSPAELYQFSRTLVWVSPWWLLALLAVGPLLYAIIYLIVRKKGKVTVGLCPRHRRKRARVITVSWLIAQAGIGSIVGGLVISDNRTPTVLGMATEVLIPILIVGGLLLLVVSLIGGAFGSRVLIPSRIDKNFIWLTKVSPEYLATFPTLMG